MKLPAGHVAGVGVHKATAYGGFGQQMLEKMGWSKGQGLGKQKHGMKEAIEVKKKEDSLGVGATSTGWKWDWKYWEDAYNTGLKSMDKGSSKKRKRQASSSSSSSSSDSGSDSNSSSSSSSSDSDSNLDSDSDSDSSEDEREGKIAAALGPTLNRDGTSASATAAELKIAKALASDPRGRTGRFSGREGKMARIRQQEEQQAAAMRAKLGLAQSAPAAAAGAGKAAAGSDSSSKKKRSEKARAGDVSAAAAGSSGGEDSSVDTAEKSVTRKAKKQKKISKDSAGQQQDEQPAAAAAGAKQRAVIYIDKQEGSAQAAAAAAFKPTPATGWWGAKMFASAGLLEGMDQDQKSRERGFDEDLQTKVYMDAHNAQRQGKKGLGKSTTLKIAGGGWQGRKVTFGEDGAEGAEQQAAGSDRTNEQQQQQQQAPTGEPSPAAEPKAQRSKSRSSKRGGKAEGAVSCEGGAVTGTDGASGSAKKKVRWGSLAVQQLQQVKGGELKWKKLWPLLLAAATEQQQRQQKEQGVKVKGSVGDSSKEKAWEKLQSCSKLQVKGKVVTLSA